MKDLDEKIDVLAKAIWNRESPYKINEALRSMFEKSEPADKALAQRLYKEALDRAEYFRDLLFRAVPASNRETPNEIWIALDCDGRQWVCASEDEAENIVESSRRHHIAEVADRARVVGRYMISVVKELQRLEEERNNLCIALERAMSAIDRESVRLEREACARICEEMIENSEGQTNGILTAMTAADRIRARGDK